MTVVLIVRKSRNGKFDAYLDDGRYICTCTSPFLAAARVLIAWGFDPRSGYVMRRQGSDRDDLISTLGVAAGLMVTTNHQGKPIFAKYQAAQRSVAAPPVGPVDLTATPVPVARAA
jgi:hypothetical protein